MVLMQLLLPTSGTAPADGLAPLAGEAPMTAHRSAPVIQTFAVAALRAE